MHWKRLRNVFRSIALLKKHEVKSLDTPDELVEELTKFPKKKSQTSNMS